MKTWIFLAGMIGVVAMPGGWLRAGDPPPAPSPTPVAACPAPAPTPNQVDPVAASPRWIIRAEGLAVVMPQEKAFAWMPDLLDENKIEGAVSQILAAAQKKEIRLEGYPVVWTLDGQKSSSETIFEKIYPTQFYPPSETRNFGAEHAPSPEDFGGFPTTFEKRNAGVTLEVEPNIVDGGKWLLANIQIQHTYFLGMDGAEFGTGKLYKVEQPRFYVAKNSETVMARNGCYVLVGVHQLQQDEKSVELFILRMTATARDH